MTYHKVSQPHVLFVCTGNTCRSVLSEYLGRELFRGTVVFESAGIRPQNATDAENAIYTLKKDFNIDASGHVPRDVRTLTLADYELFIALDKEAAKVLDELGAPTSKVKLWKIRDPFGPDLAEYDRASVQIKKKLIKLRSSGSRRHEA